MKRTFLSKLQRNGLYCTIGALLLLLAAPLYQFLILIPSGYSNALTAQSFALRWISNHSLLFLGYRALLIAGFALIISLPFTLFRIIVAQEILGGDDEKVGNEEDKQKEKGKRQEGQEQEKDQSIKSQADGMPDFAWRGKGFAVLAAWAGLFGLILFVAGTLASTLYLLISAPTLPSQATNLDNAIPLTAFFAIITFTAGGALLALSCLFFGAVIARSGLLLWPGIWLAFGYTAIALAALLGANAVEVSFAPEAGQALLTTPAILLFSAWVLWFGIMIVRLKPE